MLFSPSKSYALRQYIQKPQFKLKVFSGNRKERLEGAANVPPLQKDNFNRNCPKLEPKVQKYQEPVQT